MSYLKCLFPAILLGPLYGLAQTSSGQAGPPPPSQLAWPYVQITSKAGFDQLCPDKIYTFDFSLTSDVQGVNGIHWLTDGAAQGPNDETPFSVKWAGPFLGSLVVHVDTTSVISGNSIVVNDSKSISLEQEPSVVQAPALVGASALDPNYLPVNQAATYTAFAIGPGIGEYKWTGPSCFSSYAYGPGTSKIKFDKTGTCGGQVCVVAVSDVCKQKSAPSCTNVTRIPTLQAIQGPAAMCKGSSATFCVEQVAGINTYDWHAPAGWMVTPAGSCATITAPANLTTAQAGTIEVYGKVAVISGSAAHQSTVVTVEVSPPSSPPKLSPNLAVAATVTAAKKIITVSFPTQPNPFSWKAKVSGIGTGTTVDSVDGGARTFLMINNETVLIEIYRKNSCGTSPGNQYFFRLNNAVLIPIELQ